VIAIMSVSHHFVANILNVIFNQWICQNTSGAFQAPDDHSANLIFLISADHAVGRAANIGQIVAGRHGGLPDCQAQHSGGDE
jgi:hypothetical protein